MAISDLFRRQADPEAIDLSDRLPTFPTKALSKLLATLKARDQAVLLDLGPVVGHNVTFFGERLGCKLFVDDLFNEIDRHARAGTPAGLPAFFADRFHLKAADSVDGILAWDVFDYLEKAAGQVLASQLARMLRPEGLVLAFFGTDKAQTEQKVYNKQIVVDEATLKHREYPAACGKQPPLLNRDVIRMFEPLRVVEQFLLKTSLREVLFKKPAA